MNFKLKEDFKNICLCIALFFSINIGNIDSIYILDFIIEKINFYLSGIILIIMTIVFIIIFAIYPIKNTCELRLKIMLGGIKIFEISTICMFMEIVFFMFLIMHNKSDMLSLLLNSIIALVILFLLISEGMLRIIFTSKKITISKLLIFFIWWMPIVNLILCYKISKEAKLEYSIEKERKELENTRIDSQICNTRYPILMVHGVFFRDWQYFNYWGRISKYLKKNGAKLYYGKQSSADSIENCAKELAKQIKKIVNETGCEKVNIIAHSKGGLDSRYAISNYGMDKYVASLTTINTPHLGCVWADELLKKIPQGFVNFVAKRYNKIFEKLGDDNPDFITAVYDLTATKVRKLNDLMPDKEGILYQGYMSKMNSARSAGVPLCFVHPIVKKYEGDNDGLVSVKSGSAWNFIKLITVKGKRGISHGDMIDLMREDIKEFDVIEFFINIVSNLRERNL